jgi:hypothetical protein
MTIHEAFATHLKPVPCLSTVAQGKKAKLLLKEGTASSTEATFLSLLRSEDNKCLPGNHSCLSSTMGENEYAIPQCGEGGHRQKRYMPRVESSGARSRMMFA